MPSDLLTLTPHPQPGQVLHLEIRKRREDTRAPNPSASESRVAVRVLEADGLAARLEWVSGEPALSSPPEETDAYVELAHKVIAELRFEIAIDDEGGFGGLANVTQIEHGLPGLVQDKALEFAREIEDEVEHANFLATAPRVLNTPRLIRTAARDMEIYFSLSGAELDPDGPIIADLQVPDPLGALRLVASEVELELAGVDEESQTARVRYTQRFAEEVVQEFQASILDGIDLPEDADPPEIDLHDEADYVYDLQTGWMKEVAYRRIMSAGENLRRVEVTEIRLAGLTES
jgi:hypothetical protein